MRWVWDRGVRGPNAKRPLKEQTGGGDLQAVFLDVVREVAVGPSAPEVALCRSSAGVAVVVLSLIHI
eukprot:2278706-Alexandrium_andersonii.AAC.1